MTKLTQDMIDELNDELNTRGYCFNFILDERSYGEVAQLFLKNAAGLYSYIINLDSSVIREITHLFSRQGLKIIWNNTCSSFWLSNE